MFVSLACFSNDGQVRGNQGLLRAELRCSEAWGKASSAEIRSV